MTSLVINFVVPWGNLVAYFYRPDGTRSGAFNESRDDIPSERVWMTFLRASDVSTEGRPILAAPFWGYIWTQALSLLVPQQAHTDELCKLSYLSNIFLSKPQNAFTSI